MTTAPQPDIPIGPTPAELRRELIRRRRDVQLLLATTREPWPPAHAELRYIAAKLAQLDRKIVAAPDI